jgi:hypothetical protein
VTGQFNRGRRRDVIGCDELNLDLGRNESRQSRHWIVLQFSCVSLPAAEKMGRLISIR